jgi:hypothetical protein
MFFMSPDPLVAEDANSGPGCTFYKENNTGREFPDCMDVYEWESPVAPGGSCRNPGPSGGCLYLLSSGKSSQMSAFVDASTDGSSVFIGTDSRLVPVDEDELYDIYDVRTNGGLASQQVLPGTGCQSGAACLGSGTGAPPGDTPGSTAAQPDGNVRRAHRKPCAKKKSKKKCRTSRAKKHKHRKKHGHHKHKRTKSTAAQPGRTAGTGGKK